MTGYTLNEISGLDFSHVHQLESNDHFDKHVSHGNVNSHFQFKKQFINFILSFSNT